MLRRLFFSREPSFQVAAYFSGWLILSRLFLLYLFPKLSPLAWSVILFAAELDELQHS